MAKRKSTRKAPSPHKKLDLKMSQSNMDLMFTVADLSNGYISYGPNVSIEVDEEHRKIITKCP